MLINPFGGKKQASKLYHDVPHKMFQIAGVETTVKGTIFSYLSERLFYLVSEYAGHAVELIQKLDLSTFDAIATVSGDGLFHEMINGLLSRPDWENHVKKPIGMIAGGTASAMNKNLSTMFPEFATLSIIKGTHFQCIFFIYFLKDTQDHWIYFPSIKVAKFSTLT